MSNRTHNATHQKTTPRRRPSPAPATATPRPRAVHGYHAVVSAYLNEISRVSSTMSSRARGGASPSTA